MEFGNLERLAFIGVLIALIVTSVGFLQADFGNTYGFSNETDTMFSGMINYTNYQQTIEDMEDEVLNQDVDPSFLGTFINYGQFIFSGGYHAIKTLMSLPNILENVVDNTFIILGIPYELRIYVYALITLMIIFAILVAGGVLNK